MYIYSKTKKTEVEKNLNWSGGILSKGHFPYNYSVCKNSQEISNEWQQGKLQKCVEKFDLTS